MKTENKGSVKNAKDILIEFKASGIRQILFSKFTQGMVVDSKLKLPANAELRLAMGEPNITIGIRIKYKLDSKGELVTYGTHTAT